MADPELMRRIREQLAAAKPDPPSPNEAGPKATEYFAKGSAKDADKAPAQTPSAPLKGNRNKINRTNRLNRIRRIT